MTPLVQARTIFKVGPTDSLFEFSLTGARGRRKISVSLAKSYTEFQLKELTPEGQATDLSIPTELKESCRLDHRLRSRDATHQSGHSPAGGHLSHRRLHRLAPRFASRV